MLFGAKKYFYKKRLFLLIIFVLDFLLWPMKFFIRQIDFTKIKFFSNNKILIFSLGGLGDAVLVEPLIRFLSSKYLNIKIDVVTNGLSAEIFKLIPNINNIFIFNNFKAGCHPFDWLRFWRQTRKEFRNNYLIGFDTKGDPFTILFMILVKIKCRSGFINGGLGKLLNYQKDNTEIIERSKQILSLANAPLLNFKPLINKSSILLDLGKSLLLDREIDHHKKLLGINLGAGEDNKILPIDLWSKILVSLTNKYLIINLGSSSDGDRLLSLPKDINQKIINLSGLSVIKTAGVISNLDFFIGHDSGLTHLASALEIRTFCFFSLSHDPKIWLPYSEGVFIFDCQSLKDFPVDEIIKKITL